MKHIPLNELETRLRCGQSGTLIHELLRQLVEVTRRLNELERLKELNEDLELELIDRVTDKIRSWFFEEPTRR